MRFSTILFDLDGTLIDSGEGILRSARSAFERLGRPVNDPARLRMLIGPSMFDGMKMVDPSLTPAEVEQAVRLYRERYRRVGLFEGTVYPGVPELLRRLKESGRTLGVATTKPAEFAERVLAHFALQPFFDTVSGTRMQDRTSDKAVLIGRALEALHSPAGGTLMVGDRRYDAEGARAAGTAFCGALYGYGSREELAAFPHVFLAESPARLGEFLRLV